MPICIEIRGHDRRGTEAGWEVDGGAEKRPARLQIALIGDAVSVTVATPAGQVVAGVAGAVEIAVRAGQVAGERENAEEERRQSAPKEKRPHTVDLLPRRRPRTTPG